MSCYFARKNAIRKDPMAVASNALGFGLEICFVVAIGFFIMQASPGPGADSRRAAKAAQGFVVPAGENITHKNMDG